MVSYSRAGGLVRLAFAAGVQTSCKHHSETARQRPSNRLAAVHWNQQFDTTATQPEAPAQGSNPAGDATFPKDTWMATRRFGLGAAVAAVAALVLLANAYRVDNRERAAQQDAEAHGVVASAVVEGSMRNKQDRTRVLVVVQGVERTTAVFANRPLTRGTAVRVAWAPADPTRIYIVGARPWTWWAAMRPLFLTIAGASLLLAVAGLLLDLAFARR